jgi:hypothetical protein
VLLLRDLVSRDLAAAAAEEDFNRFDAALCDVLPDCFPFEESAAERVFAALVLEAADNFAAPGRLGGVLGDFLRDFLDIRLPFVAFGGSIIRVLRVISGKPDSFPWLGKSDGLGVWLQGIRRTACPLVG